MKKKKKEVKSSRLKKLEKDFSIIEKSKNYLEKELSKIKNKEGQLKEKIRKEKQAIFLTEKAKKLRSSGKKK